VRFHCGSNVFLDLFDQAHDAPIITERYDSQCPVS